MKVYGLWHGGSSYNCPSIPDDVEVFSTLASAKSELIDREDNCNGRTPCVSESEMHVFLTDPRESVDAYPDMVLTIGHRGGVQVSRG